MAFPSFSLEELQDHVDQKLVHKQKHPEYPLWIYNYTNKAVYSGSWNEVTMQCRGLILDANGRIVSRPLRKFFSITEWTNRFNRRVPNEEFKVYDKVDGSLGISYFVDGKARLATRGSFQSAQAIRGTNILRTALCCAPLDPSLTYLFEIVYPENQIVVNYSEEEFLVLLAVIVTETGEELDLSGFNFPNIATVAEFSDLKTIDAVIDRANSRKNTEGLVIKYDSGLRLKIKSDAYEKAFKIVSQTNSNTIWEMLKNGEDPLFLVNYQFELPPLFVQWVEDCTSYLDKKFGDIYLTCVADFSKIPRPRPERKKIAEYVLTCKYPQVLFAMLDRKREVVREIIWDLVKPKGQNPEIKKEYNA